MSTRMRTALYVGALFVVGGLSIGQVFAEDDTATSDQVQAQSVQEENVPRSGQGLGLRDLAIRPQAGAINFKGISRMSVGLLGDINFYRNSWIELGVEVGGLYSGLNNTLAGGSGFTSGISGQNSTYIFQVPTEIQIGLLPGRLGRWRLGPSVGVNTIYSSSGVGNSFGTNSDYITPGLGQGAKWNPHLAVGPEVTYSVTNLMDVGLRYDNTFMSAFNLRTLTLSIGFKT